MKRYYHREYDRSIEIGVCPLFSNQKYIIGLSYRQTTDPAKNGNGKRHCTPSPRSLRKIKRVRFDVFLGLKELVNSVKVIRTITPRGNRKKLFIRHKRPAAIVIKNCVNEYEPSAGIRLINSSPRRWNRVGEWERYINNEE